LIIDRVRSIVVAYNDHGRGAHATTERRYFDGVLIMKFFGSRILSHVVAVALLCGCDGSSATQTPALSKTPVVGKTTVQGKVNFVGTAPVMETVVNTGCHAGAKPFTAETVIVNPNGTLANVFVSIEGAPAWDGSARPAGELDQINCQFVPHAVALQVGQRLDVKSGDPTLHNVHWDPRLNKPANFGMTRPGDSKSAVFTSAEIFRVRCDVHPWMSAYVGVFDNSFFALTGSDGTFKIENVPPGQYTLVAWHETYGTLKQPLNVGADGKIEQHFEYKVP